MEKQYTEAYVYLSSPTNSQMFTTCCNSAICSDQKQCPSCKKYVYGHDAESDHQRGVLRWMYAFKK